MEPGTAEPGDVLGRQGDRGDTFWLILDGSVEVTMELSEGNRPLAHAGPGSILGELALLRRQPRSATISATTRCRFAIGREAALARILELDGVRRQVQRLASTRLAEDLDPVKASLADGSGILVRPLLPEDRDAFDRAVRRLSHDSIRRRFFSVSEPSPHLIDYLINIDYVDHFAWVVLDAATGRGMATARYVRGTDRLEAEMAFTVADAYQGRGLGTFMLGALGVAASEAGLERLIAYVMEENRPMRAVFAKARARSRFDDPGILLVTVDPAQAAALLPEELRGQLAGAVHDVVTAATLALRT